MRNYAQTRGMMRAGDLTPESCPGRDKAMLAPYILCGVSSSIARKESTTNPQEALLTVSNLVTHAFDQHPVSLLDSVPVMFPVERPEASDNIRDDP